MQTASIELFIKPSFFSTVISNANNKVLQEINEKYERGFYDQYTDIKKISSDCICSKFREIRYIPLSNGDLDYQSDNWDFSAYSISRNSHAIFHFGSVTSIFKNELKDFILLLILSGNIKLSSIYSELVQLRQFLNFISRRGVSSIDNIDESDVKSFLDSMDVAARTFIKYQASIKKLLAFHDAEYGTHTLTEGISLLCKRMEFKKLKAEIIHNRRKAIPEDYFNKLVQLLIRIMNNPIESISNRALAAILLIDSQTGLRAVELSLLEANSVEVISINDINYRMIHYKVIKTAKGNTGYTDQVTYINDVSYMAYEFLMNAYQENRVKQNSNLLYCPDHAKLPVDPGHYVNRLKRLCVLNYKELDSTNPKFKGILEGDILLKSFLSKYSNKVQIKKTLFGSNSNFNDKTVFYAPIVHQFRNTVVDRLLRKGVQLEFIRRYMGHLSQEMTDGYASYNTSDLQENINFSEATLKTYLTGKAKILGPSGNNLMERIDEWIKDQKLSVGKDLNEIVDRLLKIIPIRAKHGGMCIKGAKLTNACSVDIMTDEFYCACGICPNICHFFFHIDVTYSDFLASVKIYNYNLLNGFKRQSEKEKSKISFLIKNRLVPEIEDLEKVLSLKGEAYVLEKHPNISDVVKHLSDIKKEVQKWI